MPDLGKYADAVLGSYAVSLALILALVAVSIWRARRLKSQLAEVEKRAGRNG